MFTVLGWIVFGAFIGWLASLIMGKQSGGCMVNIALHSLTQCIGLGDDVGVSTMGGRSERCRVTSVTPAAESYADAKYK
jgi:hypothetical protein